MKKRFLLFGIALAAMVTSCYGPNDSVYTEDLDVVYTQKKDEFDLSAKTNFFVSDTVTYFDAQGIIHKSPDEDGFDDELPEAAVKALIGNIVTNMEYLGWRQVTADSSGVTLENLVFMNIILSKTTYVGGGYYPGYPGWGYPGYWYPWYPVYYTYSTGSVVVNMFEINENSDPKEGSLNIIWENLLSGYIRNGIDIPYINKGITQGFSQSQDYLTRQSPK